MLRDQGFGPALRALGEQIGTMNSLRVDLDIDEAEALGETAQVAIYTIIRELLDQAVRRGPPTIVSVEMHATAGGGFVTIVSDDAEPERRRRSFEAIDERVRQLHGTIDVDVSDAGTQDRGHAAAVRDPAVAFPPCRICSSSGRPPATRCVSSKGDTPEVGHEFEEGELKLVVNKIGASPLPGDTRACVFSVGAS